MTRSPEDSVPREPPESESCSTSRRTKMSEDSSSYTEEPSRRKVLIKPDTNAPRSKDSSPTEESPERESKR